MVESKQDSTEVSPERKCSNYTLLAITQYKTLNTECVIW